MALRGINHVTFAATDVEAMERFYVDVLGCRVVARWPAGRYLDAGGLWLAIVAGSDERRSHDDYSHIAFDVDHAELAAIGARVISHGVESWQENWTEGDSLYLVDPSGRRIEVHATSLEDRLRAASADPWPGLEVLDAAEPVGDGPYTPDS